MAERPEDEIGRPPPASGGPAGGGTGRPVVDRLEGDPRAVGRIRLPARAGRTSAWPDWLHPQVRAAYVDRGIPAPWTHQAIAAELAWQGRHVLIATGTASGKSAAYGMPALTAALATPTGVGHRGPSVLYLSPTKALAHDQLQGLRDLGLAGLSAAAVDGDTSQDQRRWARAHARWIATNPDMVHLGLLPRHEDWRGFWSHLRFVIVDEAHTYRGVFGSHVALVLRRMRRVAALYGAAPTFVAASATVAEPGTLAADLFGLDLAVVDEDGSARPGAQIVLWNPQAAASTGDAAAGPGSRREHSAGAPRGALAEAAGLMEALVDDQVSTLAFARSRRAVEILATTVRGGAANGDRVRAYRGGYLPEERRALESGLRSGQLLGLAATNALELGIDVSGLDAVILVGWPGTRSSFWQQVGRAGRRGRSALAVLVAREDPLDQYVIHHPETLTGSPVEASVLDPGNPYVLAGHLCAAAAESALRDDELPALFGETAAGLCTVLRERGLLRRRRDRWFWTDSTRAVDLVDLRGAGGGPVRVVEQGTGRLLGTVDPASAPAAVHPGALYVHQGATYEVLQLDLADRVAHAAATVTDLSTHARSTADVRLDSVRTHTSWGRVQVSTGEVTVTRHVQSYLVRRWPSGQVVAAHALALPPMSLQTVGMWWTIPDPVLAAAGVDPAAVPGAVHALEHAAIGLLPLLATCDRWDVGGVSTARHPQTDQALIVVHDGYPGGAGFADRGYRLAVPWLTATAEAIERCGCRTGCPACVQSPKCGNGNEPLDKAAAVRLARALLAEQASGAR